MKYIKYFLVIIYITMNFSQLNAQDFYSASASFKIEDVKKDTINRNIFGGFTEFLNDYINGPMGLWSQELNDRGFDYILDDNSLTSYHWEYWNKDNVQDSIALEKNDKYNENGFYSQLISNINGGGSTGIRQKILLSDTISHTFYIYAKSTGIPLTIQLLDTNENIIFSEDILTTDTWKKYELDIPKLNYNSIYIYYFISEKGKIYLDESSLMPDNNELGIRTEYADIFRKWNPSVIRYPGGSFVSNPGGVWWRGINKIDKRSSPIIYGQLLINQRMDYGLIEYLKMCEFFNFDPYIVSAYLRHTMDDHLNYLEYMMGDKTSINGSLRNEHGRENPFVIKYYEIGNEEWENRIEYAKDFKILYDTIKSLYPDLNIIAAGNHWGGKEYITDQMNILNNSIDVYGWHPAKTDLVNDDLPDTLNFLSIVGIPEYAADIEIENHYNTCRKYNDRREFKVGITEWWSHYGDFTNWILDTNWRNNSLESGLWDTGMLLGFMKNPKYMELANRTMGMSWINKKINKETGKKAIFPSVGLKSATFINNHRGKLTIPVEVNSPVFNIHEDSLAYHFQTKYLDVSSTFDGDSIYFYFINRSPNKVMRVTTDIATKFGGNLKAKKYVLTSNHFLDHETAENQNSINFTDENVILNNEIEIEPFSFVTYSIANNVLSSVSINNIERDGNSSLLVHDYLNLENSYEYVEIYDINGKLVYESKLDFEQESIDIQLLNYGHYSIILTSSKSKVALSIFKM